jgi:hypothetical protein
MVKTIAQALIEGGGAIGKIEAKQDALIRILYRRFEVSQEDIAEKVRTINQLEELDELIDRALTAKTFEEVGIRKG